MGVEVQVLGPVEVTSGAVRADGAVLASAQVRLVLAALALTPEGLSRDALADVLWSDERPVSADASLRNVLSKVRRVLVPLPDVDLHEDQGVLRLALPPAARIDLVDARRDLVECEQVLERGELDGVLLRAGAALALFDRPFLVGVHTPWADQVRSDLHAAAVRSLLLRGRLHLARREAGLAVEVAAHLLQREPLLESAHELLVQAHADNGNRALALQAYADCRRLLADDLGTAPGARLEALHLALLRLEDHEGAAPPGLQLSSVQRRLNRIRHEEHLAGLEARHDALGDGAPVEARLGLLVALGRARWAATAPLRRCSRWP